METCLLEQFPSKLKAQGDLMSFAVSLRECWGPGIADSLPAEILPLAQLYW